MQHLARIAAACALCGVLFGSGGATAGELIYVREMGYGGAQSLYAFDPATGASIFRAGMSGPQRFFALDAQPGTGTVFAIEPTHSDLYTIDVVTGRVTFVASTGLANLGSLAFDPTNGALFGVSRLSGGLYSVDPVTGSSALVGNPGVSLWGLVFFPGGTLFGFTMTGKMYAVDKTTAAATLVGGGTGGIGYLEDAALTASGQLYVTDAAGRVHEIDPASGASHPVSASGLGTLLGLVEESAGCPITTYCTAKVNSLGCTPAIGATGFPSASAGSGFTIRCDQVRNNKSGLLLYGSTGTTAIAFQCGTLCVKSQIRRTPARVSGGTPPPDDDCSGVYAIDMNAFAVGALGGAPAQYLTLVGTVVDCQWWGRDPGFAPPCNTTLSAGLQYSVCP
jgi:hypothetical protein